MAMIWSVMWILFMLGLVISTVVVAMRENKARARAAKQMMTSPGIPMNDMDAAGDQPAGDGFGNPVEFPEFDESSFK